MTIFQFILAALCCYRLTVLFSRDEVCKPLRAIPYVGHVIGCPFCISVWVAIAIETGFFFSGYRDSLIVSICSALSMSAIAIALDRIFTSNHVT